MTELKYLSKEERTMVELLTKDVQKEEIFGSEKSKVFIVNPKKVNTDLIDWVNKFKFYTIGNHNFEFLWAAIIVNAVRKALQEDSEEADISDIVNCYYIADDQQERNPEDVLYMLTNFFRFLEKSAGVYKIAAN